jgi:hypothetical protein
MAASFETFRNPHIALAAERKAAWRKTALTGLCVLSLRLQYGGKRNRGGMRWPGRLSQATW